MERGAVFIVNRSQTDSVTTEVTWQDKPAVQAVQAWQLAGSDAKEVNSWEEPERLVAKEIAAPVGENGRFTITLPPMSFTALSTQAA